MKKEFKFTDTEKKVVSSVLKLIKKNNYKSAIESLEKLKNSIYSSIPEKQRIGKGITWVLNKISSIIINMNDDMNLFKMGTELYNNLDKDSMLNGIVVFLISEHGVSKPLEVFDFFLKLSDSPGWVLREFTAIGFRKIIKAKKVICYDFLFKNSKNNNPNIRRFVSETLRPVVENNWIQNNPDYSLSILRNMFKENDEFPRTSVGNNLSDLSKENPELIFNIVKDLVESNNKNSLWIAYRSCRNLIKKHPVKVLDLLKIDEYHYKDRNYYREKK